MLEFVVSPIMATALPIVQVPRLEACYHSLAPTEWRAQKTKYDLMASWLMVLKWSYNNVHICTLGSWIFLLHIFHYMQTSFLNLSGHKPLV